VENDTSEYLISLPLSVDKAERRMHTKYCGWMKYDLMALCRVPSSQGYLYQPSMDNR